MDAASTIAALKSIKNIPRISFWNASQLALLSTQEKDEIKGIIDNLGVLSADAQRLRAAVTDYHRIRLGSHNLYLCTTGIQGKPDFIMARGMLKVGNKNLFIRKENGQLVEIAPLCVLDFYVHESCQRIGLGHKLFEAMLEREQKYAHELGASRHLGFEETILITDEAVCTSDHITQLFYTAGFLCPWLQSSGGSSYDRPSMKLHSFMAKYYELTSYVPQANQFVVYDDYFDHLDNPTGAAKRAVKPQATSKQSRTCSISQCGLLESSFRKDKVVYGRRADNLEGFPIMQKMDPSLPRHNFPALSSSNSQHQFSEQFSGTGMRQTKHRLADHCGEGKKLACYKTLDDPKMLDGDPVYDPENLGNKLNGNEKFPNSMSCRYCDCMPRGMECGKASEKLLRSNGRIPLGFSKDSEMQYTDFNKEEEPLLWTRKSPHHAVHEFSELGHRQQLENGYQNFSSNDCLKLKADKLKEQSYSGSPTKMFPRQNTIQESAVSGPNFFSSGGAVPNSLPWNALSQSQSQSSTGSSALSRLGDQLLRQEALSYPFWTGEQQPSSVSHLPEKKFKVNRSSRNPKFQNPRSSYHVGMTGFGAAQALGYGPMSLDSYK